MIIKSQELIMGVIIGGVITILICAAIYLPRIWKTKSLPEQQSIKFISINNYSFRDWALRLNEDTLKLPHNGYFRSHALSAPISLKDISIMPVSDISQRIFGQFESVERDMEIFGKFEATITDYEPTIIDIELFSGKITDPQTSVNRISGKLQIIENLESNLINGTIQIGSINYGGLPFGSTALKLSGDLNAIKSEIVTNISGHQGSTASIKADFQLGTLINISGSLNVQSLEDLIKTIEVTALGQSYELPNIFTQIGGIKIEFQQMPLASRGKDASKFNLSTESFGKGFKGAAILDKAEQSLQLGARFEDFWIFDFPYELQKTKGTIKTQAIAMLTFNQKNDDVLGPLKATLEDVTLERSEFKIENLNGSLNFKSLSPPTMEEAVLKASRVILDEAITDVTISLKQDSGSIKLTSLNGIWANTETDFEINETDQLPNLSVKKQYDNIAELSNMTGLAFKFSAPVEFSKTWTFNGEKYLGTDLKLTNTESGILTLNDSIPELTNIFIKDLNLIFEDQSTAFLSAHGTHPLLYSEMPVTIETKLQRFIDP